MPTELFASSFVFADDVSVDGFLLELLSLLGAFVSSLVAVALALVIHQSP